MCKKVSEYDWSNILEKSKHIDEQWESFAELITNAQETHISHKTIDMNKNKSNSWKVPRTKEMKTIGNKRERKWTRYMKTGNLNHYKEFCSNRNKVKKLSKANRKVYEATLASETKSNPKAVYKYINKRLNIQKEITEIHVNSESTESRITEDNDLILDTFSKYLASIFTKNDNNHLPTIDMSPCKSKMNEFLVTERMVSEQIRKLDITKSAGPDNINARVLKELHDVIIEPLTLLFNNSLNQGMVPQEWKKALVPPIHKKGNKKLASNYRPVSLTSITCKMMEKIMYSFIIDHIYANNYFSNFQHGFMKGRSTTSQLLEIMDHWTESFDLDTQIDCIYLDFKKAFDSVSHELLIHKLKSYNISDAMITWLSSFLNNRKQSVRINGSTSSWTSLTSGVPQGSIIGPLMFLLFVNDIPQITSSNIMLFADDTKLWRLIKSIDDVNILQEDLAKIVEWCQKWKLHLNVKKCKYMAIGRNILYKHNYYMNQIKIENVEFEKDIGVIFDNELEFDRHITEKINKAHSIYGMLRRTFKHLDEKTFIPLFKSMSRSQLDYASVIWNPYKEKYNEQIEKVQRRATKTLPNLKHLSYVERLKKLKLPCLKYRRIRGDLIEVYKIITGSYDEHILKNILKTKEDSGVRHSRRGHNFMLKTQTYKTKYRKNFFSLRITNIWNKLPHHVVNASSLNSFKNSVDRYFISSNMYYDYKFKPEAEQQLWKQDSSDHIGREG